jgi:hypothetical protein
MAFAAAREPWVSGFDPSRLGEDLAALGFTLLEDLDGLDAKTGYCPERDLSPMKASHIVHAIVHAKIHRQADALDRSTLGGVFERVVSSNLARLGRRTRLTASQQSRRFGAPGSYLVPLFPSRYQVSLRRWP